ncbi:MAG: hypothetical protein V1779_13470 [bacterium]
MKTKTNYEEYLDKQMQDPEFRAHYIIAREKVKLEFMLSDLQDTVNTNFDKKVILRSVRQIGKHVTRMGLF